MKAGILAAGGGTRFLRAGWKDPKPMVRLRGKPIIHHVVDNLFEAGVDTVDILLNGHERFDVVESYLSSLPGAAENRIRVWRRTTRSSFETFSLLMQRLAPAPFVISTVDSILAPAALKRFLSPGSYPEECALALAVTDHVNDEKPLWVQLEHDGRIRGMGEEVSDRRHVTAGVYQILRDLPSPEAREAFPALRNFLQYLLRSGHVVYGQSFPGALDIDDPDDVREAENVTVQ